MCYAVPEEGTARILASLFAVGRCLSPVLVASGLLAQERGAVRCVMLWVSRRCVGACDSSSWLVRGRSSVVSGLCCLGLARWFWVWCASLESCGDVWCLYAVPVQASGVSCLTRISVSCRRARTRLGSPFMSSVSFLTHQASCQLCIHCVVSIWCAPPAATSLVVEAACADRCGTATCVLSVRWELCGRAHVCWLYERSFIGCTLCIRCACAFRRSA